MGRQTSQYSLCICTTLFTLYMVNSTFYTVNFLYDQLNFLYGQCENADSVLEESTVYDRGIDLIVRCKSEVLNVLKLLIQSTDSKITPTFAAQTEQRYEK